MPIDGAKIMGALSGLGKEETLKIWQQVKDNHKRLDDCAGPHDFQRMGPAPSKLMARFRCSKCQGEVDVHAYLWYEQGRKHERQPR